MAVSLMGFPYREVIRKQGATKTMGSTTLDLLQSVLQKGLPLLLNFLDDAILFGLTRIGVSWPWLQWLSLVLLIVTLLYWSFRLYRFWSHRCQVN